MQNHVSLLLLAIVVAVALLFLPQIKSAALAIGAKADAMLFDLQVRAGFVLPMATLATNKPRAYELGDINSLPMIANDVIYEGAAVGDNASGLARPLVAADPFMGFAQRTADNTGGAASAVRVEVKPKGLIELAVTGASGPGDVGEAVYASDDDTFTLTSSGNSAVGKVHRWVLGTTCVVAFEAVSARSI